MPWYITLASFFIKAQVKNYLNEGHWLKIKNCAIKIQSCLCLSHVKFNLDFLDIFKVTFCTKRRKLKNYPTCQTPFHSHIILCKIISFEV